MTRKIPEDLIHETYIHISFSGEYKFKCDGFIYLANLSYSLQFVSFATKLVRKSVTDLINSLIWIGISTAVADLCLFLANSTRSVFKSKQFERNCSQDLEGNVKNVICDCRVLLACLVCSFICSDGKFGLVSNRKEGSS